jgi:hypothetical protein
MFKRLRVAILLYILAFIALGNFLAAARSTDWNETLWVDVYPINADGSARTQAYIDGLSTADFDRIEEYFAKEALRYSVTLDQPFRLELRPQIDNNMPQLAPIPSMLDTLIWSLRMRWFATRVDSGSDRPSPDIQLFALYVVLRRERRGGTGSLYGAGARTHRHCEAICRPFKSGSQSDRHGSRAAPHPGRDRQIRS